MAPGHHEARHGAFSTLTLRLHTTLIYVCNPPCSLGEGVNSALEDAAILGSIAAECGADGGAIAAAFDRRRRQVPSWRQHCITLESLRALSSIHAGSCGCAAYMPEYAAKRATADKPVVTAGGLLCLKFQPPCPERPCLKCV